MEVTKTTLKKFLKDEYTIKDERTITKIVNHPIPKTAGTSYRFPPYLIDYAHYYEKINNWWFNGFKLREEYKNANIRYDYEVTYTLYTIELNAKGKERVASMCKYYTKCAKRWEALMG